MTEETLKKDIELLFDNDKDRNTCLKLLQEQAKQKDEKFNGLYQKYIKIYDDIELMQCPKCLCMIKPKKVEQ